MEKRLLLLFIICLGLMSCDRLSSPTIPIEGYWRITQYQNGDLWVDVSKYNYYVDFASNGKCKSYCFSWFYAGTWTIIGMDITCQPNDGLGSVYY